MNTFVRCGSLFTGREDEARKDAVLVCDRAGRITYVGPAAAAPRRAKTDQSLDYSGLFVMPGLIDVHTHLAYGNAKTEEDIDLYSPLEFRTLRGMFFAQKCAAAGYTTLCSPGDAGQISLSIRNAIRAGLFDGPRVVAAGPYITTHQGLTDWYPTWIRAPSLGTATRVRSCQGASVPPPCGLGSNSAETSGNSSTREWWGKTPALISPTSFGRSLPPWSLTDRFPRRARWRSSTLTAISSGSVSKPPRHAD